MKEEGLPLADALRKVYDSKLFAQVNDPETGLYREGPVFLYDMLCEDTTCCVKSHKYGLTKGFG